MNRRKVICLLIAAGLLVWFTSTFLAQPKAAVAVVDAAGKPVAGAVIKGEGLGTKPGPTAYGWKSPTGWGAHLDEPRVKLVATDRAGAAHLPYPRHLSKGVQTGSIKLLVDHPDFVPNHSERIVAMTCPRVLTW